MKKIFLILIAAVISVTAFSQTYLNIGSPFGNNMQRLNAIKGLYIPKYNDTTDAYIANLDSLGQIIQIKNVFPNKLYIRDSIQGGGHKWTEIGSGGGGGDSAIYFGINDNVGIQNRAMDMQTFDLSITGLSGGSGNVFTMGQSTQSFLLENYTDSTDMFLVQTQSGGYPLNSIGIARNYTNSISGTIYESKSYLQDSNNVVLLSQRTSDYIASNTLTLGHDSVVLTNQIGSDITAMTFPAPSPGHYYLPVSVNSVYADAAGNINVNSGIGSDTITYFVLDSLNAPPVSPSAGDVYEVGTVPSGTWVGHAGDIATYNGATWDFTDPTTGQQLFNDATSIVSKWNGTTWVRVSRLPWFVGGQTGVNAGKLGSTDNKSIQFITNNLQRMQITSAGAVSVNRGVNEYTLPTTNGSGVLTNNGSGTLTWSAVSGTVSSAVLPITYSSGTISTSMATNKLIGRYSASTGVMEEIAIGTGLLLSGGTLSSTSTTPGLQTVITQDPVLTSNNVITGSGLALSFDPFARFTVNVSDSIRLASTNSTGINSVGTVSILGATITAKAATATFGSNTLTSFHYETGTGDTVAWYAKATGMFLRGGAITASAAYKPLQIDTTNGKLAWKLIDVSSSSQITGTMLFVNGGLGFNTATNGDMLYYNSGWQKLAAGAANQHLTGGTTPVWRDTLVAGGAFWALASGGTMTGQNTLTSNTVNSFIWNGTWTSTTTADAYMSFTPTLTAGASTPWILSTVQIKPTMNAGANQQLLSALTIDGTNLSVNGKSTIDLVPLRIVQGAATKGIQFVLTSAIGGGGAGTFTSIGIDGSQNLVIFPANGSTSFSSTNITSVANLTATSTRSNLNDDVFTNGFGLYKTTYSASNSTASLLFGGASNVYFRAYSAGTTNGLSGGGSVAVGTNMASIVVGRNTFSTAASGTHALYANMVVTPIGTVTSGGSSTITNTASFYIDGASSTTVTGVNYAMWVASGTNRFDGRIVGGKGANVTAANDLTLGADGNVFIITGNTQVNAITTTGWLAGSQIVLIFSGTPTVKNNTAGGAGTAVMLLAGAADFNATANDALSLVYDGTSWVETSRSVN